LVGDDCFYERHLAPLERRMLRTVHRVLHDPDAARDALQDALVRIWERRHVVETHPHAEALVLRICLHAAIDALRRLGRRRETTGLAMEGLPAATGRGPDASHEHDEQRAAVLAAIAELPRQQALAVVLRLVEERPYPEVAQVMGCSPVTARIHVMRGRSQLRRLLAPLVPSSTEGGSA
jgi:RNA polymerase sigma-70 factor (ECF subfamily)